MDMSSTNGTNTDSVSGGSFNGLLFKLLVFLLSSSAFWVAISVAVLIHFILAYVYRPTKNESTPKFYPEMENFCDKDRFTGLDYLWEHNHETFWNSNPENYWVNDPPHTDELDNVNLIHGEKSDCSEDSEKLTSRLSFKFDHQTSQEFCKPKVHSVREEESPVINELPISDKPPISNESPISTSIQKYQVVPDRNLRGFVQQPETMTISVNKLCTELKVEKLASKEERLNINLEEQLIGETEKLGLVMEPESKFDIVKILREYRENRKNIVYIIQKPECESQQNSIHTALACESSSELKQECEPTQVVKGEPEPEQVPEKEKEPEPEPEQEPAPEHASEPEPEQEPEHTSEPEHKLLDGIRCDIEAKSVSDLSDDSARETHNKSNPVYTNYEETKTCTDLGTNILSSINDVSVVPVQNISNRGSYNPEYVPMESGTAPFDSEIPLEISKRLSNRTASVPNRRKSVRRKRSIQQERLLEKPKLNSSGRPSTVSSQRDRRILTRRYVSEEFSDFDSDSQSSISDGYSVKDLVVDSDSDWFLSERESDNSPHKTYSTQESTNLVRYASKVIDSLKEIEKNNAQSFYGSETESSNSPVEISSNHHHPDEVNTWSDNNSKPEFVVQYQEEKAVTESPNKSVGSKFRDEGLKETNTESNRSLGKIAITNKDLNKETQMVILSQEDEATLEHLDREIPMETLDRYENISPRKDYATEKTTNDTEKTDKEQTMSKDKGKEYLEEEEEDELESLWEHQDLIEQLKMEIKKARAIGLPTILEESETPKTTIEELKAWHFDEKFLREAPMDELNKFYKSYRERMRKFDILNYQKMYAVGFLQLKDPLESMGSQKPLLPTLTSIFSQNLHRHRKSTDDPSKRFIKELRCDLEMVYVGQMCLSWEFLRWQYEKACEMPESDPYHSHRYNQAAGEFQQFQVLVNRFVENEPFQGLRLPNYVKNRCVLRNLLQVPVIKEDNLKEKSEDDLKGNYTITSEDLEDIMVESIRVFWEFVKADKNETPVILKGLVAPQVELQDPSDYDLMMRLNSTVQKKEKRLKDILKTGNCLVKKFKKAKEDRSNEDLFFSQVDLKLVSRVLKMPKVTSEQLQWCHKKLDKITFVNRKIQREPAFLLFPC